MPVSHHFGVYWSPGHKRPTDLDYMRHLQPSVVRILEPDPNDLRQIWTVAPKAILFLRYWWLDDGDRQQHAAMVADPVGTAHRHALEWKAELQRMDVLGNPQVYVTGVNEPDLNQEHVRLAAVEYNKVFLRALSVWGQRAGALNAPVGHPAHLHNGQPDWRDYMSLEPVIKQTNGVLVLHEYWQQEGPNKPEDWGWLAGRHLKCPMQVPILIGETGVDGAIYNRYPNNVGYRGVSPPVPTNVYADQLTWYHNHCDARVIGICPFTTDFRDNHWASFDTQPAHGDILARKGQFTSAPTPPVVIPQPPVILPSAPLMHPLPGARITYHWGQRAKEYVPGMWGHSGTDMGGKPEGTPVRSMAAGTVTFVGTDPGYGNYARVSMDGLGAYMFVAHLKEVSVQVGQRIEAGQQVGLLGWTGNVDPPGPQGTHLHIEIRLRNADGSYQAGAPMPSGRVCPESWCSIHGLKL